jgi:purine nucleoside phosphorylase
MDVKFFVTQEGKLFKNFFNFFRTHSYEGISFHEVTFQVRLAIVLGVKIFGLTNATGGIAPDSNFIFMLKKKSVSWLHHGN